MKKITILLFCMLFLVGCASSQTEQKKGTIYTNYGREVEIRSVPQRVLTFGPNCSELLCALGLEESIIGNTLDNHSRGPLPEYEQAYAKIPELNYGSATREAVLNSRADFIYGIDWEFGDEGIRYDELDTFGIDAYTNKAATIEEMYHEIEDLGQIFQIEERADAFIQDQKERIAQIENKTQKDEPIRVLVYDSGGNGIFTASGNNFESLLIEKAGGKNIFSDLNGAQWVTVSSEEVLKRDPEVIIIHDYDKPSLEEKIKEIKNDPALGQLEAVKADRFVPIALESVLPGPRMAYTIERLYDGFQQ